MSRAWIERGPVRSGDVPQEVGDDKLGAAFHASRKFTWFGGARLVDELVSRMGIESLLRLGLRTPAPAGITYLRGGPGIAGLASALTPAHRAGLLRPSALAFRAAPPESKARRAVVDSAGAIVTITAPEVVCLANAPDAAQRAQAREWAVSIRKAHSWVRYVFGIEKLWPQPDAVVFASPPDATDAISGNVRRGEPPLFLQVSDAAALSLLAKVTGAKPLSAWPATAEDARAHAGQSARSLVIAPSDGVAFVENGGTDAKSRCAALVVSGGDDAPRVATALDALVPVLAAVEDEDDTVTSLDAESTGKDGDTRLRENLVRALAGGFGEDIALLEAHTYDYLACSGVFVELRSG